MGEVLIGAVIVYVMVALMAGGVLVGETSYTNGQIWWLTVFWPVALAVWGLLLTIRAVHGSGRLAREGIRDTFGPRTATTLSPEVRQELQALDEMLRATPEGGERT